MRPEAIIVLVPLFFKTSSHLQIIYLSCPIVGAISVSLYFYLTYSKAQSR